ncbi:MAG: DUF1367 family protein [Prevotellaceae bacterium]|nr:DUF1367 family protein [Prevotellaceae bacterium]
MEILCRNMPEGFVPVYGSDWDAKRRLGGGKDFLLTVKKPRNIRFHRKFFALVKLVADNLPEELAERWHVDARDPETMLRRYKRDLGYYDPYVNERGEIEIVFRSIRFDDMDQTQFEEFYERAVGLTLSEYLPRMRREDMENEIMNFM